MIKNKINVKQIVEHTKWETVHRKRHYTITGLKDLTVHFYKEKKANGKDETSRLRIIIGAHIADSLNWKIKDKIVIFYNPDNIMQFKLVKTENGDGYKLSKYKADAHVINIIWPHKVALTKGCYPQVDYYFYNDDVLLCMLEDK